MKKRISTIVRCADLLRHVYTTVASVERQIGGGGDIVLVTDPSTPAVAGDWLRQFAARRGLAIAPAAARRPGAIRNAGMRATDSPYVVCVDAGDRLDPRFHEAMIGKLDGDPAVDLVTCSIHVFGPGARTQVVPAPAPDLDALVSDADAIHTGA